MFNMLLILKNTKKKTHVYLYLHENFVKVVDYFYDTNFIWQNNGA